MAILEIKRAAERHLAALTPAVPTAYEGASFTPTTALYQRVQFVIQRPDDPVLGRGFYREQMLMQVFVSGQANKGTAEVLARAEAIRDKFSKGTTLQEGSIRIHVLQTPQISGTLVAQDRVICPVFISLVAEVYNY
jgi:hypothetical protein